MSGHLTPDDLDRVVHRLPAKLATTLKDKFATRAFIAGGFIRAVVAGEKPSDVDVFVRNQEDGKALAKALGGKFAAWGYGDVEDSASDKEDAAHVTDFATTGVLDRVLVQIVHRWTFDSPGDVLRHFDFTVAQAAVWYDKRWASLVGDRFYPDLAAKRIHYVLGERTALESVGTLHRLMKYTRKGYNASPETVAAVVADGYQAANTDPDRPQEDSTRRHMLRVWRGIDPLPTRPWA